MRDRSFPLEGLKDDYSSPEKNLWAQVLLYGITDFLDDETKDGKETARARKARLWIFSDRTDHFGSFINLCHLFDLDPARVRKRLLEA